MKWKQLWKKQKEQKNKIMVKSGTVHNINSDETKQLTKPAKDQTNKKSN